MQLKIAVLLTCHNRKRKTLACLENLHAQAIPADTNVAVYLVDAGSTDGTKEVVEARFPSVRVIEASSDLFWNGGMRVAWAEAEKDNFDCYLWLNDDTHLKPDALARLLDSSRRLPEEIRSNGIIVGSTSDPETGKLTYGGLLRSSRIHPLKYQLLDPRDTPQTCHTMNGNCVLIPREAAHRTGNLSDEFTHGIGDFDYGLRARAAGCTLWVAPGFVGTCASNAPPQPWNGTETSFAQRWRRVNHPKGLPFWEYRKYAKRHGGKFWPVFWLLPYVRLSICAILPER